MKGKERKQNERRKENTMNKLNVSKLIEMIHACTIFCAVSKKEIILHLLVVN